MALAALGAAAVLDVGSRAAEAAPSASPFAGTYVGGDPLQYAYGPAWTVTIADDGRIAGVRPGFSRDKISGQVGADGRSTFTVTATILVIARRKGHSVSEGDELEWRTVNYKSSGTIAPDLAGNLVGTVDAGGSFLWVRQ
jgi:hypothetical protein